MRWHSMQLQGLLDSPHRSDCHNQDLPKIIFPDADRFASQEAGLCNDAFDRLQLLVI
jgi:hypothetical protein